MSLNIRPYLYGATEAIRNLGASVTAGTTGTAGTNQRGWFSSNSSRPTFSLFSSNTSASTYTSTINSTATGGWAGFKRILAYLFAVVIVIGILLLFVHFFIRPVFKWRPGAPGWIPVPGWDDGTLFWEKGSTGPIKNDQLPIRNQETDYTLQVDLFLQNPLQFSTRPRILLTRGAMKRTSPSGDSLIGLLEQYNLAVALKPDTNDLIVSVLNKDRQMETAILPNVPVQEVFRLTVALIGSAMEVYLNGHLVRTVAFRAPPLDVKGAVEPATGVEANIVRYRNLKIWSRVLTSPEIRSSSPAMSSPSDMGAGPIPTTTSSCG